MSNETLSEGSSEDKPELETVPDQSAESTNLGAGSRMGRVGERGISPKDPMPMGNPKISIQS